ncbi:50S ribosomal protein L32 [bacterium]|nr:50S ribosomal protein L32 [bacterium]
MVHFCGELMPLPKQKTRRSHTRSRRAANFLGAISKPEMNRCPKCGSLKRMHFTCQACGFYAGRQVFIKRERVKKTDEEEE